MYAKNPMGISTCSSRKRTARYSRSNRHP